MKPFAKFVLPVLTTSLLLGALAAQAPERPAFQIDADLVAASKPTAGQLTADQMVMLQLKLDHADFGLAALAVSFKPDLFADGSLPPLLLDADVLVAMWMRATDEPLMVPLPIFKDTTYYVQPVLVDLDTFQIEANAPIAIADHRQLVQPLPPLSDAMASAHRVQVEVNKAGKVTATFDASSDGYAWLPIGVQKSADGIDVHLTLELPGVGEGNCDIASRLETSAYVPMHDGMVLRIYFTAIREDGEAETFLLRKQQF